MVGDYWGTGYSRPSSNSDEAFSVEGETTSSMHSAGKEYTPVEWTDEKHSLYLKSMEASFVNQLYNSLGSVQSRSNRKTSEEQFKVLRDGFWQKLNVRQPEYRANGGRRNSHEFLRSPWIKHYRTLPKTQSPVEDEGSSEPESQKGVVICSSASGSNCSHSRDRDQISIGQEVSDQNFVNEVTKGKKMKTVLCGSSSTDQVVPLRKPPAT